MTYYYLKFRAYKMQEISIEHKHDSNITYGSLLDLIDLIKNNNITQMNLAKILIDSYNSKPTGRVLPKGRKSFVMSFSKRCLNKQEIQNVFKFLQNNTSVKILNLSNLRLDETTIQVLANLFVANKTITSIDLSNTGLTNETIIPIIKILESGQNNALTELNLEGNNISRNISRAYIAQISLYLRHNARQQGVAPKLTRVGESKMYDKNEQKVPQEEIEISENLCCPITHQIMLDPVLVVGSSKTYEREAIEEHFKKDNKDPITREALNTQQKILIPNAAVRGFIDTFLTQHPQLWGTNEIYESKTLKGKLATSVQCGNIDNVKRYIGMDRRLLKRPLEGNQTLLGLACQQTNPEMLSTVITELGDVFWEQIGDDGGIKYFQLATKLMGEKGAKIIADKLSWGEKDIQEQFVEALNNNALHMVKVCLQLGANINAKDNTDLAPIHRAIISNNSIGLIQILVNNKKTNLNAADAKGRTVLHLAVLVGNEKIITRLLETKRIDINRADNQKETALHYAVKYQVLNAEPIDLKQVEEILEEQSREFRQPAAPKTLAATLANGKQAIFEEYFVMPNGDCGFIAIGATRAEVTVALNSLKDNKQAQRFLAPEIKNAFITNELQAPNDKWKQMYKEYDKNQTNLDSLFRSVKEKMQNQHPKVADLGIKDFINWLQENGHEAVAAELQNLSRAVIYTEEQLHTYCQQPEIFQAYIKALSKNLWLGYKSALLYAEQNNISLYIWRKDAKNPQRLVAIAHHDAENVATNTIHMLHTAGFTHFNLLAEAQVISQQQAKEGIAEEKKEKVKEKVSKKRQATGNIYLKLISKLIANKANLELPNSEGNTALMLAVIHNDLGLLITLLGQKVNLEAKDVKGYTALQRALAEGNITAAMLLVNHGADLNSVNPDGDSILIQAIKIGYTPLIRLLFKRNPDLNIEAQEKATGNTALHIAAQNSNQDIVDILMQQGANAKTENNQKQRPVALARKTGHNKVAQFIKHKRQELKLAPHLQSLQQQNQLLQQQLELQQQMIVLMATINGFLPQEGEKETKMDAKPKLSKLLDGLIGHWDMNGRVRNLLRVKEQVVSFRGVKYCKGLIGQGITFWVKGYVTIPYNDDLASQRFSVGTWVKPLGNGGQWSDVLGGTIIEKRLTGSSVSISLVWCHNTNRFIFKFGNENIKKSADKIFSSSNCKPNKFYHVVGTYDGNVFRLYVDGKLEASHKESRAIKYNKSGWALGGLNGYFKGQYPAQNDYPATFNGVIDMVRIYNRALTPEEIQILYYHPDISEYQPRPAKPLEPTQEQQIQMAHLLQQLPALQTQEKQVATKTTSIQRNTMPKIYASQLSTFFFGKSKNGKEKSQGSDSQQKTTSTTFH